MKAPGGNERERRAGKLPRSKLSLKKIVCGLVNGGGKFYNFGKRKLFIIAHIIVVSCNPEKRTSCLNCHPTSLPNPQPCSTHTYKIRQKALKRKWWRTVMELLPIAHVSLTRGREEEEAVFTLHMASRPTPCCHILVRFQLTHACCLITPN